MLTVAGAYSAGGRSAAVMQKVRICYDRNPNRHSRYQFYQSRAYPARARQSCSTLLPWILLLISCCLSLFQPFRLQAQIVNPGGGSVTGPAVISALGYTPLGNAATGVGADGQIVMKNGAGTLWHTVTPTDVTNWLGYTPGTASASGTNLQFGMFTGTNTVTGNSRVTENAGGTIFTYSGTGGIASPTFSTTGSTNGEVLLTAQGSFGSAPAANQSSWAAPSAYTTSARYVLPTAPPSTVGLWTGTNSSGTVSNTFTAMTGTGTVTTVDGANTWTGANTFNTGATAFNGASVTTGSSTPVTLSALTQWNNAISQYGQPAFCSYTYAHNGASNTYNGTTAGECAFLKAAAQADSTNYNIPFLIYPSAPVHIDANCMPMPDHGFVNLIGINGSSFRDSTIISDSCTGYMVQASTSNSGANGWVISNVRFNGNGVAAGALAISNSYNAMIVNIAASNFYGANVTSTSRVVDFPLGTFASYKIFGYNWDVGGLFGNYGGSSTAFNAAIATVASDGSGNITSATATISNAGTGYTGSANDTYWFLVGPHGTSTYLPCATVGTITPTYSTGTVTNLAITGYSGCTASTTFGVVGVRMASSDYGVYFNAITDSRFYHVNVEGVGRSGCIGVNYGSVYLDGGHAVYCPTDLRLANETHLSNFEHDSTLQYGLITTQSNKPLTVDKSNYYWNSVYQFQYLAFTKYVFVNNFSPATIIGDVCDSNIPGTNTYYQELMQANGTIITSGGFSMSNFNYLGNRSCSSTYTAVNMMYDSIGANLHIGPPIQSTATTTTVDSSRLYFDYSNYSGGAITNSWFLNANSSNQLFITNPARTTVNTGTGTFGIVEGTASTAGTMAMNAPVFQLRGTQWDTGSTSSKSSDFRMAWAPTATGAAGVGTMTLSATGTDTAGANVTLSGNGTTTGGVLTTGALTTAFTTCNGTQSISASVGTISGAVGGTSCGQFTSGTAGTVTVAITLPTAPNGWVCDAHDITTTTDTFVQNASTTTSATLTGTLANADKVLWSCKGF